MVDVIDLRTSRNVGSWTCDAETAVIAAYAQVIKGDFNTQDYREKYGHLIIRGESTVICGERMCALLPVDLTQSMLKRFYGEPG